MKTYIKPTTNVALLRLHPLMQLSKPRSVTGLDDFEGVSSEEYSGGTADSRRRFSVWDDDEEE